MESILKVKIVDKSFKINNSKTSILNDISFSVDSGEFVSIIGPSGCGKTTILRLILGLDLDYDGEIIYKEKPVQGPDFDKGIVFQDNRLLPWLKVTSNIKFALKENEANNSENLIKDVIKMTGLEGFENAWPRELSGGMQQRVNLARALVNLPELLLLDEPFGALDDFLRNKLQNQLKEIVGAKGITSILVTHNIEEAIYLSDTIYILSGSPASVAKKISVKFPKKRDKKGSDFINYRNELIQFLYEHK